MCLHFLSYPLTLTCYVFVCLHSSFFSDKFYFLNFIFFVCAGSPLLHRPFSSCCKQGYSLAVVRRLLTAVASLAVEHRLWGVWASVLAA